MNGFLRIGLSFLALMLASGCALPTGLLRSRWAMEDFEYAEKYADGAERGDLLGKLKQAADARFQENASGMFISAGYAKRKEVEDGLFAVDIGGESYMTSYLTGRASLLGMVNDEDWYTGVDTGIRLQSPSRLAPFVGIGFQGGAASETVIADDDGIDNDDDGSIDERREKDRRLSGALAAFYPEVGTHFWWTPQLRLSGYGRYLMTTEGREHDDWLVGFGIAVFTNPDR
ncbi:MAG: hypothetical protein AAFX06_05915 [Planctomycetota bacterium]